MSKRAPANERILALYPMWRGCGFVLIEGRTKLVRWGIARLYSKDDEEIVGRLESLVERFGADVLAIEDIGKTRRRLLAQRRIRAVTTFGDGRGLQIRRITQNAIMEHFGKRYHYEVAAMICDAFPELAPHLPKKRRPWDSEDPRMCLFKTSALAIVAASSAHP